MDSDNDVDEYIDLISDSEEASNLPENKSSAEERFKEFQAYLSKTNLPFLMIYEFIKNSQICFDYVQLSFFEGSKQPCLKTLKNRLINSSKITEKEYMTYLKQHINKDQMCMLLNLINEILAQNDVRFFFCTSKNYFYSF